MVSALASRMPTDPGFSGSPGTHACDGTVIDPQHELNSSKSGTENAYIHVKALLNMTNLR